MAVIHLNAAVRKSRISKNIYGHFSEHLGRCIYNGLYVGEDSPIPNVSGMRTDLVEALKRIRVPVLRWPGGCFADEYHWLDGVGPRESRKKMINTHWGGVVEDNSFGTHEFLEFCRQVGCEPYINGNVGSGTVREMSEWMEYMTFDGVSPMAELRAQNGHPAPWKVKYFGVGNENWGCGGNMRPEFYADQYRRYQTYVRNYGDNKVFRIACGPNADDYEWMDTVMKLAGPYMDGISLHYYTVPGPDWQHKTSATGFDREIYYRTLFRAARMEELVTRHSEIMDRYDPQKRVALVVDEWGTWYDVEPGTNPGFLYQQNTMRDAMVAALTLNILNEHSSRVRMANIAQMVNVLQAVILTEGERMLLTPTYHIFDLYQHHQDADLIDCHVDCGRAGLLEGEQVAQLSASASVDADGLLHLTAANLSADGSCPVAVNLAGFAAKTVSARILAGKMGAYNTFEQPEAVKIAPFDGVSLEGGQVTFTLPPCSAAEITLAE